MSATPAAPPRRWAAEVCLALALVVASHAVPAWLLDVLLERAPGPVRALGYGNAHDLVSLAFGALLALPAARASGLRLGARPPLRAILVAVAPVIATLIIYPNLPTRPFAGQRVGLWAISPMAQDLLFVGYLYGRFDALAPSPLERRGPGAALLVTAAMFAAWHVPNFRNMPNGYVLFQLAYTFVGLVVTGLSRQWTGSALYTMATHVLVNFVAWKTS